LEFGDHAFVGLLEEFQVQSFELLGWLVHIVQAQDFVVSDLDFGGKVSCEELL
jgi:hypothetical protein